MRTCNSTHSSETLILSRGSLLSIVEMIAFRPNDTQPLLSKRRLRKQDLHAPFLARLAGRPEKVIFLQCSCTKTKPPEWSGNWIQPSDKHVWLEASSFESRQTGFEGYCQLENKAPSAWRCCHGDGRPRLTRDLLRVFQASNSGSKELIRTFPDLIKSKSWVKQSWLRRKFRKSFKNLNLFSTVPRFVKALESLYNLTNYEFQGVEDVEKFYLELAGHMILNLGDLRLRSVGYLTPFLPNEEEAEEFSKNSPLAKFLARVAVLGIDVQPDEEDRVALFCIDMANMVFRKSLRCNGKKIPKFTRFGDALIFSALLGFGEFEPPTYELKKFKMPGINFNLYEGESYRIRKGGIYDKRNGNKIEHSAELSFKGSPWANQSELAGLTKPRAKENPMYYLDRMEDAYQYNKPECEGWRRILSQDPHLGKVIERPEECDHLAEDAFKVDHDNIMNAKKYFDALDETGGGGWSRKYISSRFVLGCASEKRLVAKWRPPWIRTDDLGFYRWGDIVETIQYLRGAIDREYSYARSQELRELRDRLIRARRSVEIDRTKPIHSCLVEKTLKVLDDYDYLHFRRAADEHLGKTTPKFELGPQENARHIIMTSKGIEIIK